MGAHYKETFTFASSNPGTNAKRVINWIIEKAGLTIVETKAENTSTYDVYCSAFSSTDVLIEISNSSSTIYFKDWCISSTGTTTIGGRSGYYSPNYRNANASFSSEGSTTTAHACTTESCIAIACANTCCILGKFVDMCSGSIVHAIGSPVNLFCSNGSVYSSMGYEPQQTTNNGYVRARPEVFYSPIGFVGQYANPTDVCYICSNGDALGTTVMTEISIGGHIFVSISNSRYIKIS